MDNLTKLAVGLALIGIIAAGCGPGPVDAGRIVAQCQEDAVLIGMGAFEDGRWTWYECGPALDNFGTE